MNFRFVVPAAVLTAVAAPLFGQSTQPPEPTASVPSKEEELALTLPTDEWYIPKSNIQFGIRVLSSGATVKFGQLGNVAVGRTVPGAAAGDVTREYDNGYVQKDGLRSDEKNTDGSQSSTPGGRYQTYRTETDGTKTLLTDYLSYTSGKSRYWQYARDSQLSSNGLVALSTYRATSEGASAQEEEGMNSGLELTFSRVLGRRADGRFEWGVTAGVTLNSLNAKTSGTVTSTLHTYTDYYKLNGFLVAGAKGGPTFEDILAADGTTVSSLQGRETTVTVDNLPVAGLSTDVSQKGAATVKGNWQIKGGYFLMRVGPSVRAKLNDRWSLSASVGVAGAFVGTRYAVTEQLEIPDIITITDETSESVSKVVSGYYADFNVDWWATDRSGLFAGVNAQYLDGYDQTVSGRTAKIELGSAVGIRGGFNVKF